MSNSTTEIANCILRTAWKDNQHVTNLQLQNLVYIAVGTYNSKKLTEERPVAYQFGPVYPKLYNELRKYGNGQVTRLLKQTNNTTKEVEDHINEMWNQLKELSETQLRAFNTLPNSPWHKAWNKEPFSIIKPKLITKYYHSLV